jgi:hypothetical protein
MVQGWMSPSASESLHYDWAAAPVQECHGAMVFIRIEKLTALEAFKS